VPLSAASPPSLLSAVRAALTALVLVLLTARQPSLWVMRMTAAVVMALLQSARGL
jgi:hypothetical protein